MRCSASPRPSESRRLSYCGNARQKTGKVQRLTGLITVSGALAGMIFLALSGFAIQREMDAKTRVRAQLNILNAKLEQRVEQRTAALQESQDRLSGILLPVSHGRDYHD